MHTTVYVFFPGKQEGDAQGDIQSWEMYHWPAVVVEALLPQAVWHGMLSVPARRLRERLPRAIEVVEAAARSEETETAQDDAEALIWELTDFVRQCEAHEHLTGSETLFRTQS